MPPTNVSETKLIVRTRKGDWVKAPVTLVTTKGRIEFVDAPFILKDEIKAMKGARWHGYLEGDKRKIWSIDDCPRNRFQLDCLQGENVYEWFDRPLVRHAYERPLMDHQKDLVDSGLTYHYQIWAAEMGCVDGEAIVRVNRASCGFKMRLCDLYYKFHGGETRGRSWDRSIPTYICSLKREVLGLNPIVNVLKKGIKEVVRLTLTSGKVIRLTPDHEVCVGFGQYRRAESLKPGDTVLSDRCFPEHLSHFDTVVSVEPDGECEVYDVVCQDPHRNFVADGVVVHNCGKTLAAQEVMERSCVEWIFWVGPKSSLPNIEREFRIWNIDSSLRVEMFTYEGLARWVDARQADDPIPRMVIFDESSKLKTPTSQRSTAAQTLADLIRERYGFEEGYVIEMSGTPSPKSPLDWWSPCEIAWPGFLREGSRKALENRLAFMIDAQYETGVFKKRIGWKDDERKCDVCGEFATHPDHDSNFADPHLLHTFQSSKNEVAYMHERLKGLVVVKHKKDCLSLPEKRYRKIDCKPSASTLRVAKAIASSAENMVTGLTLLRELSDGFQYRDIEDGRTKCSHCVDAAGSVDEWFDTDDPDRTFEAIDMLDPALVSRLEKRSVACPKCHGSGETIKYRRIAREVPCPKVAALRALLEENEEIGRLVVFAGFTGSVDRITNICRKEKWSVVRLDGRGYQVTNHDGEVLVDVDPLDFWADTAGNSRVAFVSHPESGGMSLTLVEARMAVYWSNSFKPEYRTQLEDRIHRKGMDENLGCTIVDLVHLPTDERVLEVIQSNRKLELMTMGQIAVDLTLGA